MNRDRLLHVRGIVTDLNESLCHLHHRYAIWTAYAKRMRALPDGHDLEGEAVFHEWLAQNYADSMAIGIRRVVFSGSGATTCMIELLSRLQHDEDGLTMLDAMAVYGRDDDWSLRSHQKWLHSRFFLDPARAYVSRSVIGRDIERLGRDIERLEKDDTLERIKEWADKRVAHSVPAAEVRGVAFDEVAAGLKVAGDVLYDYSVLLTGSGMTKYTPVIADYWEGILDRLVAHPSKPI